MTNPQTFMHVWFAKVQQYIQLTEDLRVMNNVFAGDSTIVENYFSPPIPPGQTAAPPPGRTDIVAADCANAQAAMVQMLFAYDSGSPTQKSQLYKMIP